MAHDVFVSYSSKDKPVADAAVAALEARGIRCWIAPRDIVPGIDWSEALIEAINDSRVMLLVFSQHANESHQIKREVERAVAKGIPVIPLRIEDVPLAKSLEYFISMPHWIDALTPERQRDLDYLAETVGLLLERQGNRPAPRPATPPPQRIAPPANRLGVGPIVALTTAVATALAVVGWFALRPPKPPPGPVPPIAREATAPGASAAAAAIEPRLAGDWDATVTARGVTMQQRLSVARDGRFRWQAWIEDTGTAKAGSGGLLQTSRTHGPIPSTYAFHGPDAVTITGPLGPAEWKRTRPGAGGSATFDAALSGAWESRSTDPEGRAWISTLEMTPTGEYVFRATHEEEGVLTTNGSRYQSRSTTLGTVSEGELSFQGSDVVTMRDAATGEAATWKRRS